MDTKVFRIALRKFGASAKDAFSGQSGYAADGRWHTRGHYLDYAAESRSLATLERLVHYKRFDCLTPHVIFTLEIPNVQIESELAIPPGWDGDDLLSAAQTIGDAWCDRAASPVLQVASAVTPGEHNFMVNTRHPNWDWGWVKSGPGKFDFDARLVELLKLRARKG